MQEHLTEPFRPTSRPRREDSASGRGPKMSIMGDAPRLVPWLLAVLGPAIAFTVAWPDVSRFAGRFQTVARVAGAEWFVVGLAFWASAAVGVWLIVRPAMRSEEAYVARRFLEEHAAYRANVRALWPLPYLHTLTPRRLAGMALFATVLVAVGAYVVPLLR